MVVTLLAVKEKRLDLLGKLLANSKATFPKIFGPTLGNKEAVLLLVKYVGDHQQHWQIVLLIGTDFEDGHCILIFVMDARLSKMYSSFHRNAAI